MNTVDHPNRVRHDPPSLIDDQLEHDSASNTGLKEGIRILDGRMGDDHRSLSQRIPLRALPVRARRGVEEGNPETKRGAKNHHHDARNQSRSAAGGFAVTPGNADSGGGSGSFTHASVA